MAESEFRDWQFYVAKRNLPSRRIELMLAQLCMLVHTTMGGAEGVTLSDYLLDPVPEPTAEDEIEFFEFRPYKKTQG